MKTSRQSDIAGTSWKAAVLPEDGGAAAAWNTHRIGSRLLSKSGWGEIPLEAQRHELGSGAATVMVSSRVG
jgi:hypothetical protein